ncbi:hypothetical protein PoB_004929000 [Plakobranchus ocellatus]|uniref:Uncharacterized protein n=1 Tax=Plakobranchus ocellatus TaxID=259542 RepID=A0AAV4BUH3_9GAST|nr:hypothetical protein PoB_004929000 [Plakobranchus ocellatus]
MAFLVGAFGYQVRGPRFESQSGPSQFFIAPLCPPSTKWTCYCHRQTSVRPEAGAPWLYEGGVQVSSFECFSVFFFQNCVNLRRRGGSSGRVVAYSVKSPSVESLSASKQFFIGPLILLKSVKSKGGEESNGKPTTSESCMSKTSGHSSWFLDLGTNGIHIVTIKMAL